MKQRKDLGMTQIDFAEHLSVTRQTVSRWETGAIMPDIDKITDIAKVLGVSCDYLLKDEVQDIGQVLADEQPNRISRLLLDQKGQHVKLTLFEYNNDYALVDKVFFVVDFKGNWMQVTYEDKDKQIEKLIPISSIASIELVGER